MTNYIGITLRFDEPTTLKMRENEPKEINSIAARLHKKNVLPWIENILKQVKEQDKVKTYVKPKWLALAETDPKYADEITNWIINHPRKEQLIQVLRTEEDRYQADKKKESV